MGLFSKAKKLANKTPAGKAFKYTAMGQIYDKAGKAIGGGGLDDLLKGKKKTYAADELADDINGLAGQGLNDFIAPGAQQLNEVYSQDPNKLVNNQIGMENKLMRGASNDAMMRTRQLLAQRGLQNSSVGLQVENNSNRALSDKLAMNNAGGMERLRNQQIENAQGRMQVGSNLFGLKTAQGPIQMNTVKRRVGGMGQLLGTLGGAGAGAAMGGPQGAQVGAQLGGSLGGYYQNS